MQLLRLYYGYKARHSRLPKLSIMLPYFSKGAKGKTIEHLVAPNGVNWTGVQKPDNREWLFNSLMFEASTFKTEEINFLAWLGKQSNLVQSLLLNLGMEVR